MLHSEAKYKQVQRSLNACAKLTKCSAICAFLLFVWCVEVEWTLCECSHFWGVLLALWTKGSNAVCACEESQRKTVTYSISKQMLFESCDSFGLAEFFAFKNLNVWHVSFREYGNHIYNVSSYWTRDNQTILVWSAIQSQIAGISFWVSVNDGKDSSYKAKTIQGLHSGLLALIITSMYMIFKLITNKKVNLHRKYAV